MPDEPDASAPDVRGGKEAGDPGLAGATETGGSGPAHPPTDDPKDSSSRELPGEKGGAATGGGA